MADAHRAARRRAIGIHFCLSAVEGGQHVIGSGDEDAAGVGEPYAPPLRLEKGHPGLALEDLELLRHGGRGEGHRFGDSMDCAAVSEFPKQA